MSSQRSITKNGQTMNHRVGTGLLYGVALAIAVAGAQQTTYAAASATTPSFVSSCCNPTTFECTSFTCNKFCTYLCIGLQATNEQCLGIAACNLPDGSCIEIDARCCDDAGGTIGGLICEVPQACCKFDGTCEFITPSACAAASGMSRGAGTDCSDPAGTCGLRACCVGVSHVMSGCENHTFVSCVQHNGTDLGLGYGVFCESLPDADGDGVFDNCDNCDQFNPLQEDDDGDGFPDACDNCSPSNPAHACSGTGCFNPDQSDCDANGIGDICDTGFVDCDGDGTDDCCDPDSDGDGVPDVDDACPFNNPLNTVDANGRPLGDFDGDCFIGLFDYLTFIDNYTNSAGCTDTSATCVPPVNPPPQQ